MQTFLPYADFALSARTLDRQRLNKQTVETLQIMKVIVTGGKAWANHPAVRMWRGHEEALMRYQVACVEELTRRGYSTVTLMRTADLWLEYGQPGDGMGNPPWFGDDEFHRVHRQNLLRKDPEYYGQLFEDGLEPQNGYIWPIDKDGVYAPVDMRRVVGV